MFAKSQTKVERSSASSAAPSIISADMRVSGNLDTEGDVQVDGFVDGDVRASSVSIGKSAEINGEVVAGTVRIWGKVNGRVRGGDVALQETAQVNGDVLHETIEIARGAQIDGTLKRQPLEQPKPTKVNLVVSGGEPMPAQAVGGLGGTGAQAHKAAK